MRVLFDINHPAHVHFFRNPIRILAGLGHEIIVTSREKEMAVPLLDALGIEHIVLSVQKKTGGLLSLGRELVARDVALYKIVRERRPDVMASIGGTFIAHVGFVTRIPSLVFYDTENAKLQNAITYPFAHKVIVPNCYGAWTPGGTIRYNGYHELSYLGKDQFVPSAEVAIENGLAAGQDNFFLRTVSWNANHDVGEQGWSEGLLTKCASYLASIGKVHISSEADLPPSLAKYKYQGDVANVHHVMALSRLFVGESATMASECAVSGVPAIYAANTGRGYTDEQEHKYELVKNLRKFDWPILKEAIDAMLSQPRSVWAARREKLLSETIKVAPFVAEMILARGGTQGM